MTILHWSIVPGNFVMKRTGEPVSGIPFEGTVREWYETLVETIVDCFHELTRGREIVVPGALLFADVTAHPDVGVILQCTIRFRPHSPQRLTGLVGYFTSPDINVHVDPDQPRDVVKVVLRQGSLFEEAGTGSVKVLGV